MIFIENKLIYVICLWFIDLYKYNIFIVKLICWCESLNCFGLIYKNWMLIILVF